MRKKFLAFVVAAIFAVLSCDVWSLPHHNRSDVDDWVKIFIPIRVEALGTVGTAMSTHQHDAITAGTPAGQNSATTLAITHTDTISGMIPIYVTDTSGTLALYAVFTTDTSASRSLEIPAETFISGELTAHQHAAISAGTPTVTLKAAGTNAPLLGEVNSLGVSGIKMIAAGSDAHILAPLPDNICIACPVKISIAWSTNDVTITDTATWKVLYRAIAAGEALAAPTTALDTVITADSPTAVAYALQETPQGTISAGTLSRGDTLHFLAELDAVSGLNPAVSNVYLHGVYVEYIREKL